MIIQGSTEWFAARRGKVTASRVHDIIRTTKTGPAASRKNYMTELVLERLTNTTPDSFTNEAMQWGTDHEGAARDVYSFIKNVEVEEFGFLDHPTLSAGASPDGLIGSEGGLEIKCPNSATHIETLRNGKIKPEYITQMQWNMACSGRQWWDFMSFDPRMPEGLKHWIKRIERDQDRIDELEAAVSDFLKEVEAGVKELQSMAEAY